MKFLLMINKKKSAVGGGPGKGSLLLKEIQGRDPFDGHCLLDVMPGTAVARFHHEDSSLKASQEVDSGRAERWKGSVVGCVVSLALPQRYIEILTSSKVPQNVLHIWRWGCYKSN